MTSKASSMGMITALLLGAGASASIGCHGSSANAPPPETAATVADDDASGLIEHHRYHHHGGVLLFIAMSLDTLGVSPEQRTAIERIRANLHAGAESARAAEQQLIAELADGVAAGNLDAAKVDDAVTRVTRGTAAMHDSSTGALNELHAVLTPPQRAALADKVESHWAVWQKANTDESGPPTSGGSGHLSRLAAELDLTADQVEKIRAGLAGRMDAAPRFDPQEIAAHLRAFGDAFRSETFDARGLATATTADAHLASWGAANLARVVETVSPVLTPDQRAEFAQRLREHATHNPNAQANP